MIEDLFLTLNAQFFRQRKDGLADNQVLAILEAAMENSTGAPALSSEFRKSRTTTGGTPYAYSLRVFLSSRPVYFVENTQLEDQIYAYILLIEFKHHVAIFRKSCANVADAIDSCLDAVTYSEMVATIDDRQVAYQKLSARQMTVAETAIRMRSYEAVDLKGSLSAYSTGRSVPYFLRLRDGGRIRTLSLSTGRLFDSADRQKIDVAAEWALHRLAAARTGGSAFISSFARNVGLPDVLRNAAPNAILVDASGLVERMETEDLRLSYTTRRGRVLKALSNRAINAVISALEQVYEISTSGEIADCPGKAIVKFNKRTLTFDSNILRHLKLKEGGKEMTLQRFLIANNLYTITFTLPSYVYTSGSCFEDQTGVSAVPAIKKMLEPIASLATATSEKGSMTKTTTRFSSRSVFAIVERQHVGEEFLVCDDLGDEWADHIAFDSRNACITFIHSKHGDLTTSASKLHDVVGQAVKNIGNMTFDSARFMLKYGAKWNRIYTGTQIRRLRRGDGRRIRAALGRLLADYRLHKKCIIACSFLSRSSVLTAMGRLQRGQAVPGHITQLLWILSSFAHAVREAGGVPIVYCAP